MLHPSSVFCLSENLPSLTLQPAITPELVQGRAHLKCTWAPPGSTLFMQYTVVWSRLVAPGTREQIRHDTTPQAFSFLEMSSENIRLGDTVMPACTQQHAVRTPGGSNPFWNHWFSFCLVGFYFIFFPSATPHLLHLTSNVEKNTETGACCETGLSSIYQIQDS